MSRTGRTASVLRNGPSKKAALALAFMLATTIITYWLARSLSGDAGLDLIKLSVAKSGSVEVTLSPWLIGLLILWSVVTWWIIWPKSPDWEPSEVTVEFPKIGKVVMKPSVEVATIAYQAWSEITTRKAHQEFDEENDVISDIYDSWYELFGVFRTLLKTIPVERLRLSPDARQLRDYMGSMMNEVLRPHLTRHQARFRAWFAGELARNPNVAPQTLQRSYPEYESLVRDLKHTCEQFLRFAEGLGAIAFEGE